MVRHLDIGTAKPSFEERQLVPHHLIDILDPGARYSAYRFIADASEAIAGILGRGRKPILVGGTGFYLRSLSDGVVEIQSEDMTVREELEGELRRLGPEKMYERLMEIDPLEAGRIHANNQVRVLRALEIFRISGKTKSELNATGVYRKSPHRYEYFCLAPNRTLLYERINGRVGAMMKAGLLQEINVLIERGHKERIRAANIIGYNELLDFIDGLVTFEEALRIIKQNTRRYAKRQMTWFRRQSGCRFYSCSEPLCADLVQHLSVI